MITFTYSITFSPRVIRNNTMKTRMKKSSPRSTLAWAALAIAIAGLVLINSPSVVLASTVTSYSWQFGSAANPIAPDSSSGGTGVAKATITPGQFSEGWLEGNPVFGDASGIWDLGKSGVITLADSSGLVPVNQSLTLSVQVVQWIDGGIYNNHATVSVQGGTAISTNTTIPSEPHASGGLGGWILVEISWTVAAGTPVNAITINGAATGSVIDSVSVQAFANATVPPPQLAIQSTTNGQVQISWSSSYNGYVLQSNSDLNNAQGWAPVQGTPQSGGGINWFTIPVTNGAQFFRLEHP